MAADFPVAVSARDPRAPADRGATGLSEMADAELLGILRALPRASERRSAACEVLVARYRGLVQFCAQRYRGGPEPFEDLMQVAYIGLLKAINNFDPAFGGSLTAYAHPSITGEIKRHFRDNSWQVHVNRSVQELAMAASEAARLLAQDLGRAPDEAELARHLGVTTASLRDARQAEMGRHATSLDMPLAARAGTSSLVDVLGADDPRLEHLLSMQVVASHWGDLPALEQKILLMRFHGNMTQAQIGGLLGISQTRVSRLLARALAYLRPRVLGIGPETHLTGQPGHGALPGNPFAGGGRGRGQSVGERGSRAAVAAGHSGGCRGPDGLAGRHGDGGPPGRARQRGGNAGGVQRPGL
jgi:RNA polymerase sigma-B factor